MRQIDEDEAFALAGECACPVLREEEADEMEATVCFKQFPCGYVLGASDKVRDLQLWFTSKWAVAEKEYERYVSIMRACGSPFGEHIAN
jgi:hypothetical protein